MDDAASARVPEPWLRGTLPGVTSDVGPAALPVFFSFAQVREDLAHHLPGLTAEQVWRALPGGSLGFHLRHLARSVDRLSTYLIGEPLSEKQLAALDGEQEASSTLQELQSEIEDRLAASEVMLRRIDATSLFEARWVGRRRLPTTVMGLLVHLAEHTQRHLGQVITLCHMLRAQ